MQMSHSILCVPPKERESKEQSEFNLIELIKIPI